MGKLLTSLNCCLYLIIVFRFSQQLNNVPSYPFSTLVGVAYDTESHVGLCRAACNLDKVVPKLRLDWAVNLAYFSTEHHLIELPHHLTRAKLT